MPIVNKEGKMRKFSTSLLLNRLKVLVRPAGSSGIQEFAFHLNKGILK